KAFLASSCFKPERIGQRGVRERLLVAGRPAPLLTAARSPTPWDWRLPKPAQRVEEKTLLLDAPQKSISIWGLGSWKSDTVHCPKRGRRYAL
ncbi:hypothetical protein HispidOSU_026994, partial [Sigmodon hispidus]